MRVPLVISLAGCLQKCSFALMEARHRSPSQGHGAWTLSTRFRRAAPQTSPHSFHTTPPPICNRAGAWRWRGQSHGPDFRQKSRKTAVTELLTNLIYHISSKADAALAVELTATALFYLPCLARDSSVPQEVEPEPQICDPRWPFQALSFDAVFCAWHLVISKIPATPWQPPPSQAPEYGSGACK